MKTKMGFGHKFAYSFFDFAAYKEFLVQGFGKSILYLFLVTLIFSTLANIGTINTLTSEVSNLQDNLTHNAPNFEFKNSLLTVDSDKPIYYKYHSDFLGNLIFSNIIMIDTINTVTSEASNLQATL